MARAAHPDDWEERELDGQMLYESSGGIPHGRLAIVDGAIKKADVISTAREKKLRLSTSAAHQRTVQENEELKRHNENLQRHNENLQHKVDMHERILVVLLNLSTYSKLVIKKTSYCNSAYFFHRPFLRRWEKNYQSIYAKEKFSNHM